MSGVCGGKDSRSACGDRGVLNSLVKIGAKKKGRGMFCRRGRAYKNAHLLPLRIQERVTKFRKFHKCFQKLVLCSAASAGLQKPGARGIRFSS